ncbi:PaaX family transcriptional regulator C-terminal domain-containing protein [Pseudonocardia alni]|jgi:phenylacetic acid degradation operon negative regulatory protein|nr:MULTISPECIES: PaaX family transcriptional regulator C-terminal domain-containing protein [Pseudonocardia]MCO7194160.1 PaaX family transcriptional regulator [Pseudonocardia sp. McavD-2-B]MYW73124.1 PaaX family transcriptional regulator [Pseudonocardia sp. SID8383]
MSMPDDGRTRAEPQLLLTSLLGDYWYWRDEHIPSAALVRLLAEFGIGRENARAAMRRLAAKGLLTTSRAGRTTAYGIPPRTSDVIVHRTHRMLVFGASAPPWDGRWTVVAFSVPEQEREIRTALRSRLRVLGLAALYDGLWVSPHDLAGPARDLVAELGIGRATVLRATEVPGGPHGGGPASAFDVEGLAAEYAEFVRIYAPLRDGLAAGRIGPAEALRIRTELRVAWRTFPERDPDLPAVMLPAGWARPEAQRLFIEVYDRLGPLAEHRFRQVLAEVDPGLAELASHHDSARIARLYSELGDRRARGDTPFEQAVRERRLDEVGRGRPSA